MQLRKLHRSQKYLNECSCGNSTTAKITSVNAGIHITQHITHYITHYITQCTTQYIAQYR